MNRLLTITAAEWASVTDGTLWLVRPKRGEEWTMGPDPQKVADLPPVEFVQVCAPCETCGDQRIATSGGPGYFKGGRLHHRAGGQTIMEIRCPDCRIELVGPCPDCGGDGWTAEHDSSCDGYERCYALGCPVQVQCASCQFTGIATLGHAYAVGKPLPIAWGVCDLSVPFVGVWRPPYPPTVLFLDPDEDGTPIDLAHAGPVEWLVGKWAIELRVVGS